MAVYTHLDAGDLEAMLAHYDVGAIVSAKGIAEGVSNSNWLIETTGASGAGARFILTLYEHRTRAEDLPFFLGLLDHLAAAGLPVPRTIHDRDGAAYRTVHGKPGALIEFLPGISVAHPSTAQARAVGVALARLHRAARDYGGRRANTMHPPDRARALLDYGEAELAGIDADLPDFVARAAPPVIAEWPRDLPRGIVHADLFPDNVLFRGERVAGLIDFYFACEDMLAYDLAVTHAAFAFDARDNRPLPRIGDALLAGYTSVRALFEAEIAALPLLAQAAALRFVATRVQDWLTAPAGALVQRKPPMEFAARCEFYREAGAAAFRAAAGQASGRA